MILILCGYCSCFLCVVRLDDFGECWPLDAVRLSILKKNRPVLCELLDTDDDLINEMSSRHCLTEEQLDKIRETGSLRNRNVLLVDTFERRSIDNFRLFEESLNITQPHLVPLLNENDPTGKYC